MSDPIASALRRSIVAPLVSLQHDAEQTRRAWLTREQRALARDSVILRSIRLDEVKSENERLRRLLGLGQQLEWGFVPAEVLHSGMVTEAYTVTLSAGERSGVRPFSPVVAPDGLVGMVKTVDPTLSIAITFAHPDFRVSAMASDGTAFGIVAAHLGEEPERYLLELRGVAIRNALKPGVLIVSSGLGGVFPRGIPIGTVMGELRTSEVWARTYLLRPAVAPADLSAVMVLLPRRVEEGVEGVWAIGRSADSAVKRIVAAGDSIARDATRPERPQPVRAVSPSPDTSRAAPRDTSRRDTVGVAAP